MTQPKKKEISGACPPVAVHADSLRVDEIKLGRQPRSLAAELLSKKIIQAPLAGYSCAPFRKLAWEYGQVDFCCTEMLSAKHIWSGAKQRKRYWYKDPNEGPLCVQLAGDDPDILKYAAETMLEYGADVIDLNCGCPQPKIRKKNYGSQLLNDSKLLYRLVQALKVDGKVPVFIKIRVDNRSGDQYNHDVASAIEQAGADAITVHGRHWTERYDTPVSYHDIAIIKQSVSIPVIGNGDISDSLSAKKMFDQTQCDAIMIGRASIGQPWLSAQIYQELQNQPFQRPSVLDVGKMFIEHVRGLMLLEHEKNALLQARSLAKYYIGDPHLHQQCMTSINGIENFEAFKNVIQHYFS